MRRFFLPLTFALLLLVGVTDVSAQSAAMNLHADESQESAVALTEPSAGESAVEASSRSVVLNSSAATNQQMTRRDIQQAMLADVTLPSERSEGMQQEDDDNRTLLYVAGGTLVAAGITAAIILLAGGDDGDNGGTGIPGPPGRPE